jgi:hypothetical protein
MKHRRALILFVLGSLLVWLLLFHRFLFGLDCFGYRDTAHLYYPLFEWIQESWRNGTVPLWNRQDDFGAPLVGDGISSVFYPLKGIFFLDAVPYSARFGWYVSIHVLVAAWGSYFLARRLGCSQAGSALAAAAYSLGGAVLFQVNNVVYLVGAAWFPWSLGLGWSAIRTSRTSSAIGSATCIALMVLGGDPQAAYHAMLILAGAVFLGRPQAHSTASQTGWRRWASFGGIVALALALSAIQLLPTYAWSQRSIRASGETQRSIWESIAAWQAGDRFQPNEWLFNPSNNTHHEHIYQFSQPPWSAIEFVWPNVTGKEFPTFRRWTSAIPAADRVWTPSLYCGLVVFLLATVGMRWRRGPAMSRTVTWLTLLFGLGSLGWYGAGWLWRELSAGLGLPNNELQPSAFGVYWWFVTVLPGYAGFRYPAKLMVVATLGIGLLAGLQLSELEHDRRQRLQRLSGFVTALSLGGLGICFWPGLRRLLSGLGGDATFGPFDAAGAIADLRISFVHTLIGSSLVCLAMRWMNSHPGLTRRIGYGLVALTILDLSIANAWLVARVPHDVFAASNYDLPAFESDGQRKPWRMRGTGSDVPAPPRFAASSSPQRLEEVIASQRSTLFPKFHLPRKFDLIGSFHALEPLDLQWFNHAVGREHDGLLGIENRPNPSGEVLGLIGFVEQWRPPPFSRLSYIPANERANFETAVLSDLERLRTNEAPSDRYRGYLGRPDGSLEGMFASQVEIDVDVAGPVWLVLKEYWDAGWEATVTDGNGATSRCVPERFAGIFRAVYIPRAGQFRVRFDYRPKTFIAGAAISAIAWVGMAAVGLSGLCRVGLKHWRGGQRCRVPRREV